MPEHEIRHGQKVWKEDRHDPSTGKNANGVIVRKIWGDGLEAVVVKFFDNDGAAFEEISIEEFDYAGVEYTYKFGGCWLFHRLGKPSKSNFMQYNVKDEYDED
jgi:hypothetical protein